LAADGNPAILPLLPLSFRVLKILNYFGTQGKHFVPSGRFGFWFDRPGLLTYPGSTTFHYHIQGWRGVNRRPNSLTWFPDLTNPWL
jgi:hypothetical protein